MRYTVYFSLDDFRSFDGLAEAAAAAMDDERGSRLMVYDNREERWVCGADLLLAYVNSRRRPLPVP